MIALEDVRKVYRTKRGEVPALDGVSFSVETGEFLTVRGPSGSGKSTLLLAVGGMVRPTEGTVTVDGKDVYALSAPERAAFRAGNIGFVFQMFHLVPYLTVLENVLLPTVVGDGSAGEPEALALLERFRMTDRAHHKPAELSTGERQRAALARALLRRPGLLLADEPTGNLDPENAAEVMGYLTEYHHDGGTVVVVTHEQAAADHAHRTVTIRGGKIEQ
jgi:ABC-type lipoprotein export system ATPase subunit